MQSLARSSAASRVTFGATKPRDGCCELNGVTCPISTHKLNLQHDLIRTIISTMLRTQRINN